jgi:hypothetical protein
MAIGGPQAIPGVTLHEAYRFEAGDGDKRVEGFVYKVLARRMNWEARIDGTAILVKAETRREAVERAVAETAAG